MGRKIALTNQKGGVGKTTAALGLAAALTIKGQRVLLVDLDAQGNASASAGLIIETGTKTLGDLLAGKGRAADYIVETDFAHILPSNNALKDVEGQLTGGERYDQLKGLLQPVEARYDYILFDCPPSINAFTKNALAAADEVIIPVDVGFFSILGLKQLLEEIEALKKTLNRRLHLRGVLISKFDRRTALSDQVYEILKNDFADRLFKTVIRVNIDLVRAQIAQQSIFAYNPRSTGAEDFMALAEEIIHG